MAGGFLQQRLSDIKTHYDVVVVGGGIYGATVAWEAVSRGLSVLLMEKNDFGSGTSANSLKTIHGGLRSLQRLDFKGMREYIRERRALMRIAPHLIEPMQCVIPTYAKLSKSKLLMWSGINIYDLIAYDRNNGLDLSHRITSCHLISKTKLVELTPGLDSAEMTGGTCWYDAQVYNSERLVLSFIMSAARAGANVYNYLHKNNYLVENEKITGVLAVDHLSGKSVTIRATAVIDCTGPWATQDEYFQQCLPVARPKVMAKAVNLVIKRKLSACALGVAPKGNSRLLFIAPWREGSIVGTWYFQENKAPEKLALTEDELNECLTQINSVFPSLNLSKEDVTLVHRGLQPADIGKSGSEEPELWTQSKVFDLQCGTVPTGLYWVQGVKLTTARDTAVELVNTLARNHEFVITPSHTHHTALYGGDIDGFEAFTQHCQQSLSPQHNSKTIYRLVKNYGSNIEGIIRLCEQYPSLAQPVPGYSDALKAELKYALNNEMPYSLSDMLLRRLDIGTFTLPGQETITYCADVMAEHFGWSKKTRQENIEKLIQFYPPWCHQQQVDQQSVTYN